MRTNGRNRTNVQGSWAPDRNDEYLFYQALLGTWPAGATAPADRAPDDLIARMTAYMRKAVREAKVHTSWIHEDQAYGAAVERFVARTLGGRTAARFLGSFVPFVGPVAEAGMVNSLAQLVLKLASPGVPDFYQGAELWDLSLVDPDNRRPVDFEGRQAMLSDLEPLLARVESGASSGSDVGALLDRWQDGRIKLFITACGLRFRRAHSDLMLSGGYTALDPQGPAAAHIVAFSRHDDTGTLVAVVPRLTTRLVAADRPLPLGEPAWGTTIVPLLPVPAGVYRHVITGEAVDAPGARLRVADALRTCPVALLWSPGRLA
jgi:(1->4)-alpha-D-glucan 1-alpha-D-glucosylmutase